LTVGLVLCPRDSNAADDDRGVAGPGPQQSAATELEPVIVTARRKEERLQDVPQTITAVTAGELERLDIRQMGDIDRVVSGLQVDGANISMRGVTSNVQAAAFAPTVATYFNDVPVISNSMFTSIFDVGQVEVLRGPQGTVRGIASPSGAITLATRKPELAAFGASISAAANGLDGRNVQAAVNVPVLQDKLAIRVAGVVDRSDGNGVKSIHSDISPGTKAQGSRVSVRFEPTDTLGASVVYHEITTRTVGFGSAVFGPGSAGGVNPNAPAGFNGPPIAEDENIAVADEASVDRSRVGLLTAQLDWTIGKQRLTYVGSRQDYSERPTTMDADTGNIVPGHGISGTLVAPTDDIETHEVRLASAERLAGGFDYVIGAFHQRDKVSSVGSTGVAAFLPGAFGAPGTVPVPGALNTRYQLNSVIDSPRRTLETSLFGNVVFHAADNVEVSAGARRIDSRIDRDAAISTTSAFSAARLSQSSCVAAGGQFAATYAGVCDVPFAARNVLVSDFHRHNRPWIHDASIVYHIDPDRMVYARTGTSWREGPFAVGINNARNDPRLLDLTFLDPEKSESYEVGMKWSFLDRRGRSSIDYYHQKYDGLIYTVPNTVPYLSYTGAPNPTVSSYPFSVNVPAKVDGVDLEVALEVTRQWSVSANAAWAYGRLRNASVPCNDGNFDGVADTVVPTVAGFQANNTVVARCVSNAASSTAPRWNARVQSEYRAQVGNGLDGFIRGLVSYEPTNPNSSPTAVVPGHALADIFIGVRDPGRRWEVAVYGKNITDTRQAVSIGGQINPPGGLRTVFGETGYRTVSVTPQREFGFFVRHSFGSD
jgi:iron complex outermembrane receptor protein